MKKLVTLALSSVAAFALLIGVMGTGMSSCSSKEQDSIKAAQAREDSIRALVASIGPGTKLEALATLPGVKWSVVTYKGVCQPTTTRLYVSVDSVTYSTSVTGISPSDISDGYQLDADAVIDSVAATSVALLQEKADADYLQDLAKAKQVARSWASRYSWTFGTDYNCYNPKVSVADAASGTFRASACGSSMTLHVARKGDSFYVTNRAPNPASAP